MRRPRAKLALLLSVAALAITGSAASAPPASAGAFCSGAWLYTNAECIHGGIHKMAEWWAWSTDSRAYTCTYLRAHSYGGDYTSFSVCGNGTLYSGYFNYGTRGFPAIWDGWSPTWAQFGGYFSSLD